MSDKTLDKGFVASLEFLKLVRKNKLIIKEQKDSEKIKNTYVRCENSNAIVFAGLGLYFYRNAFTFLKNLGLYKSSFVVYFITIMVWIPEQVSYKSTMIYNYESLALEYYDEMLKISETLQAYEKTVENSSKQQTIENVTNPTNLGTYKKDKIEIVNNRNFDNKVTQNDRYQASGDFYESHPINYDSFDYTEKDITTNRKPHDPQTGKEKDQNANDNYWANDDSRFDYRYDSGYNYKQERPAEHEQGTQRNKQPEKFKKIEFR